MKFLIKYDNFLFESSNPDVLFYDKNGSWFSKGKLSDVMLIRIDLEKILHFRLKVLKKIFHL